MSKAILVIDMPEIDKNTKNGCRNCKFAKNRMTLSEEYLCVITEQSAYVYDMNCPLKPIPKEIGNVVLDAEGKPILELNSFGIGKAYINGYNHAIREILGEEYE